MESAEVFCVAASYWNFHVFSKLLRSPAIWGTGGGSFRRFPLVEFGVEASTFADKTFYVSCGAGVV